MALAMTPAAQLSGQLHTSALQRSFLPAFVSAAAPDLGGHAQSPAYRKPIRYGARLLASAAVILASAALVRLGLVRPAAKKLVPMIPSWAGRTRVTYAHGRHATCDL